MIRTRPSRVRQMLDKFVQRANSEIIVVKDNTKALTSQCFCFSKEFLGEFERSVLNHSLVWVDASQRLKSERTFQRESREVDPTPRKAFPDSSLIIMMEVDHSVVLTHSINDVLGDWTKLLGPWTMNQYCLVGVGRCWRRLKRWYNPKE